MIIQLLSELDKRQVQARIQGRGRRNRVGVVAVLVHRGGTAQRANRAEPVPNIAEESEAEGPGEDGGTHFVVELSVAQFPLEAD
jgi:hypothetical protein